MLLRKLFSPRPQFDLAQVRFQRLTDTASLPAYATNGAAGMDVFADEEARIYPTDRKVVKTGVAIAVPDGYEAQCRPRSGLAAKAGITILNAPGTIDCDYRGEVLVILHNTGETPFVVNRGDRIAQLVIVKLPAVEILEVADIGANETARGTGGLGSTGVTKQQLATATAIAAATGLLAGR